MISRQLPNGATVIWRSGDMPPPLPSLADALLSARVPFVPPKHKFTPHKKQTGRKHFPQHGRRICKGCGEQKPVTEMVKLGKSKDYVFCKGKCADDRQKKIDERKKRNHVL